MMKEITISVEDLEISAELNDTLTARKIFEALPLEGSVHRWGEEVYFMIPVEIELEADATADVEVGDLAYWPSGPAFCIFFGRTPVSASEKPRAYSAVNVFGQISGDPTRFTTVTDGSRIRITASRD